MLCLWSLLFGGIAVGLAGKHDGGKHEGGKKHGGYGVGYVEEGGVVGYSCHDGWEQQGDGNNMVCIMKEKLPLLPTCQVGILEGNQCLIREPAVFTCPPGFVEVGGYGGKKHHEEGKKKHGGKKHGGGGPLCMKVDRVPFETYCPMGTTLSNGQCLRMEISPATMICPLDTYGGKKHGHEGGKKHGHEGGGKKKHSYIQPPCVETIDVAPILTCPPNLKLKGTVCVGMGQGPCPMPAPAPLILDSKKAKHGHYRRLQDENGVIVEDIISNDMEDEDSNSEIISDVEGLAEGEDIIEENRRLDAEDIINEDLIIADENKENLNESAISEDKNRNLGEKHGGHGGHGGKKHGEYGPPILPMIPTKTKMCDLEIIEPAIPACPPGSIENMSYDHHKKKKHGGFSNGLICVQTVDIPLEPYCPLPGSILRPNTMTCESQLFEGELTRCPPGFEPCNNGGEKKHKHHGGFNDSGCCAVQYSDPIPGCPLNTQLIGGQCLLATEPMFQCPPNAIQEHDFCFILHTKPPKIHYQINVTTKQTAPVPYDTHKKHKKHH